MSLVCRVLGLLSLRYKVAPKFSEDFSIGDRLAVRSLVYLPRRLLLGFRGLKALDVPVRIFLRPAIVS